MPRPGPRLPMVGVRMDATEVDREAARETRAQRREVTRSEMMKILLDEALAVRSEKRRRK